MHEGRLTLRAAMRFRSQRWATACSGSTPLIAKMTNPEETRPGQRDAAFHWSDNDSEWMSWTPKQFIDALDHPLAEADFKSDMDGLTNAEALVLVMPCGRSAHLEMGYAAGAGMPNIILMSDGEPELMYWMATRFAIDLDGVVESLKAIESGARS